MTEEIQKESRMKDWTEKMIVGLGMVGIFLPVRLVFYTYVTQYWLGSVGVVSAIAATVTILAHYDKLGWFGRLWKKQIHRIAKGKLGTVFLVIGIVYLCIYAVINIAMQEGTESPAHDVIMEVLEQNEMTLFDRQNGDQGIGVLLDTDTKKIVDNLLEVGEDLDEDKLGDVAKGFGELLTTDPETFRQVITVMIAVINTWSGGWFQHFYIVFMVEEVEKVGLIIYFRWFYKPREEKKNG